jgi:hypothetical protein
MTFAVLRGHTSCRRRSARHGVRHAVEVPTTLNMETYGKAQPVCVYGSPWLLHVAFASIDVPMNGAGVTLVGNPRAADGNDNQSRMAGSISIAREQAVCSPRTTHAGRSSRHRQTVTTTQRGGPEVGVSSRDEEPARSGQLPCAGADRPTRSLRRGSTRQGRPWL